MHKATTGFSECFERLPEAVKKTAKKNFDLLKIDPLHPSLHFKKIGKIWPVRIGLNHRAPLCVNMTETPDHRKISVEGGKEYEL